MTIEKLTDEERRALLSQFEWPDKEDVEKALRIIDRLALVEQATAIKAKCDAQAAVIERVRAVVVQFETCSGYDSKHRDECRRVARRFREALGATPEHTVLDDTSDTALIDGLSDSLAAANARVAELAVHAEYHRTEEPHALEEALRRCTDLESQCRALSEDRDAANARADAAKALFDASDADRRREWERAEKAERERDEARQQRGEWAEALNGKEGFHVRLQRAESEAAALRAEVERWKGLAHEEAASRQALQGQVTELRRSRDVAMSKLAAANALTEAAASFIPESLWGAWMQTKRAHLSGQAPAQSEAMRELAAANELLDEPRDTWTYEHWDGWRKRVRAHLSGQAPARSEAVERGKDLEAMGAAAVTALVFDERTDHERAVLKAMANARIEQCGSVRRFMSKLQEDVVCRAELARREAEKR